MTKFILIGGYPHKAPDSGKALCEELCKGLSQPITLLDCLFARPRENWEDAFEQDKAFFTKNLPNAILSVHLANTATFLEQIQAADIIYFRGGDTGVLLRELAKFPTWINGLFGKTVAGTSAGMDMLSTYNYNTDTLQVEHGLGLLPIKTIPHWRSDYNAPNVDWDLAKTLLENYQEPLPLVTLGEGEFRVMIGN